MYACPVVGRRTDCSMESVATRGTPFGLFRLADGGQKKRLFVVWAVRLVHLVVTGGSSDAVP
ncbi:unnamed protein product [Ectocarpus sp. 12 AP-2014]